MRLLKVLCSFEVRGCSKENWLWLVVQGHSGVSILGQLQGSLEGEIHGESLGKGDQS